MMANTNVNAGASTKKLVGMAIFTAIIVVLQLLGSFIKIGPFAISLVLIPIVVGAAVYGAKSGAYFGLVFGVIVLINCITGADPGGNILWTANPLYTALVCLVKGGAAGLAAGAVFQVFSKKNTYLAVILAAMVCPIVNTGIFCGGMMFLFHDILVEWAGGTSVVYYMFFGLAGVNFLLEFVINIVLSPIVVRILHARLIRE
ncbi:MAG: ECF transporter S component [Oscillospiraceae bacterium]